MQKPLYILLMLITPFALGACTLSSNPETPEPLVTPTPIASGAPEVIIGSPDNGDEITLGDDVLVSAIATDTLGVTSVQLFADDTLVKTLPSQDPGGDTNFPVVLDYTPRSAGELLLEVIAYRGTTASEPATLTITVLDEQEPVQQPISTQTGPVIDPNDPTCRILTNTGLNYRTGPGVEYDRVGTFAAGTQVPIVGRVGDNSWWQVRVNSFTQAWVSADFTSEYGNCINIPVVTPPPTPTTTPATATPTATPIPPTSTSEPTLTPTASNTPRPADLVISNITGLEDVMLEGGSATVTFSVTISNTGDQTTGPFTSVITFLPGGDDVELGAVSSLEPGGSINLSAVLTFEAAGEFTVQAEADSDDSVTELSEVNNIGTFVLDVRVES
jgi:uncharacterized protein YraI